MRIYGIHRLTHPKRAGVVAFMCERYGVTREHLLATIKKRQQYRQARMYRKRSRRRTVLKQRLSPRFLNMRSGKRHEVTQDGLYAGEGELHPLLRVVGLTQKEFCAMAGMDERRFQRWYGHPLYSWPVELLRYYGWAQNMAKLLKEKGYDPDSLKPKIPERPRKEGRYPRKAGQLTIKSSEPPGDYDPWTKKGSPFAPENTSPTPIPSKSKSS